MILRRNETGRFSTVLRAWQGETVVLIGGGPSITAEQIAMAALEHEAGNVRCIAVNDAYLLAPWADVCYFADSKWWKWHTDGIDKPVVELKAAEVRERFASFKGQKCSIEGGGDNITDDAVHMLRNANFPYHSRGLSKDQGALVTGWNGGFQVLNMAALAGVKRALLLGYDGQPDKNGRGHFHGEHPRITGQDAYPMFRQSFSAAEQALIDAGVQVINCSPGSAIESFPKMAIEDALSLAVEA